jgi:hypothetical protein
LLQLFEDSVDLLAGARISGRAWMEESNIRVASQAGLGVLLSTSEGRVIVKAMKPGLPAYLSGAVAHGDTLVEINGRLVFVRCRRVHGVRVKIAVMRLGARSSFHSGQRLAAGFRQ